MSETLGAWELRSRLGQTALGETHLARRERDGLTAVVTVISRELRAEPSAFEALKAELTLAARLEHPAVAAMLEQSEAGGVAFVAMEHVDGVELSRLLAVAGGPVSMERAASLLHPVLDALGAAHALSPPLLHRNLAPEKVLVTRDGRVVVTGLGLGRARLRAGVGVQRPYVSPEQARGTATDARSEVFAAGLLLFELVCGRLPAQGGAGEVISRIAIGELDAPLAVNPGLDAKTVAVLSRALALKPEERFTSAREFCEALAPWKASAGQEEPLGAWVSRLSALKPEPPAAPPPKPAELPLPPAPPVAPPRPNRRRPLLLAGAAGLATVVGLLVSVVQGAGTHPQVAGAPGRPLEVTSVPSGAQVFVDGVLEERRTPLTLIIPKDEFRTLILKKQGAGAWTGLVHNVHKLEVALASGTVVEDRYEGQRPPAPKEPAPPTKESPPSPVASPAAPRRAEVVFDAEQPPLEVVLTAAHSVTPDTGPALVVPPDTRLETAEGALVYNLPAEMYVGRQNTQRPNFPRGGTPWGYAGSQRRLGLFALRVAGGVVEVLDLGRTASLSAGGEYHLFSPTESSERAMRQPSVLVNGRSVELNQGNLLRVDSADSFRVRVLMPRTTYRLEATRADGKTGPLPGVLMSVSTGYTHLNDAGPLSFDAQPLPSGQALVGAGSHTLRGARSAWFTIVTAQGVVPPDVKLTIRAAASTQQR